MSKARFRLEAGVGAVDAEASTICELGACLRMGVGGVPDPDAARELYGLFQLLPGEERPEPGEGLHGVPVFCFVTQSELAKIVRLSPRQLANLEKKGLSGCFRPRRDGDREGEQQGGSGKEKVAGR